MILLYTADRNAYPEPNTLHGCLQDGLDIIAAVKTRFGDNAVLYQDFDSAATKAEMVDRLKALMADAKSGDWIVFHESGHGATGPDPDPSEPDGLVDMICPIDFDWDDPATWLTDVELSEIVAAAPPGVRWCLLFDSCHSGHMYEDRDRGMGTGDRDKPRHMATPPHVAAEVHRRQAAGQRSMGMARAFGASVAWVAGCTSDGTCADAYEDGKSRGAFTWAFLKALCGYPESTPLSQIVAQCRQILAINGYEQIPQAGGLLIDLPFCGDAEATAKDFTMADSKGIRAGRAFVELFVDGGKLTAGLKAASAKLKAWGASITAVGTRVAALGAAVATPLAAMAIASAKSGAELYDLARRTGMSTEALSSLSYAAAMSGNDMETLEAAVGRMQKSIGGVADVSEGTTGSLAHLGLTAAQLAGMKPEEQFALIAQRIAAIQDPTQRAAAAMTVFGRSGAQLIPLLEDFQKYGEQAKAFGFVKDPKAVAEAKAMENALTLLGLSFKSLTGALGGALMPLLRELFTRASMIVLGLRDWVRDNKALIVTVFQWGLALAGAGAALVVTGKAVAFAGAVLSGVVSVVSMASGAVSALGGVIGFLLNPIGLIIGALVALGAYLLVSTGAGGKALDWLGARFGDLADDATAAWGGIGDALASGDIGLAARIVWLTLKMEWTRGVEAISEIWNGGLLWLRQRMSEAFYGAAAVCEIIWHGLEVAWIETTAFMSGVWTNFVTGIRTAWDWCAKSLEESWNKIKGVFSDFDAAAANKAVEARYQDAQKQMWDAAGQQKAAREEVRKQQRGAAAKGHEERMAGIGSESKAAEEALRQQYDQKMQKNQEELDKAKKEWQEALDAAHAKRQAKDAARGPAGALESPDELMARLKDKTAGLNGALAQAAKIAVVGTFNASAAWGLGGGSGPLDRIAKATEATAKNTAKRDEGTVVLA